MKRWLPIAGLLLGVASAIGGLLLYPDKDDDGLRCGVHVVYRDLVKGTGEIGTSCPDGTTALAGSLAVIVLGIVVFVAGWFFLLTPHAARITTRIPAQAVIALLLVALAGLGTGGYFGWEKYQDHRDAQRLHRAELALARLALPSDLTPVPDKYRCFPAPYLRCAHSDKAPLELRAELLALVHGTSERHCTRFTTFPCSVFIRGTIDGYPVFVLAQADMVRGDVTPPAGATKVARPGMQPLYYTGTQVELSLAVAEE